MKEDFLHFVWKTLNFGFNTLKTIQGDSVRILRTGIHNTNQGPDFLNASINIGGIDLFGQVEIHLKSSDWNAHKHQFDPMYNSVILHVVLESDRPGILRQDGTEIPEIALKNHILPHTLRRYYSLESSQEKMPCSNLLGYVPDVLIRNWMDRMGIERLERKSNLIKHRQSNKSTDWEQLIWEELAAYLGGTVNQDAFRELAVRVPIKMLRKIAGKRNISESILFGMAGMLSGQKTQDPYLLQLKKEWEFQRSKLPEYSTSLNIRYLRMRPPSFPTHRISQLAAFPEVFSSLTDLLNSEKMKTLLDSEITASEYWKTHYRFGELAGLNSAALGKDFKEILLINTLAPLSILYQQAHGREQYRDDIVELFCKLPPEDNRISREFSELGIKVSSVLHSQGILELRKHYCAEKKCLNCAIGYNILKKDQRKWNTTPLSLLAQAPKPE